MRPVQASANAALSVLLLSISIDGASQVTVAGHTPGSFRVTETGAAEYSVPIRVPPGIAGMEPKLSFVLNSQARNGLLGVGWTLAGLSAIHRCSKTIVQDGFTSGVNFDANDRYCIDGQRLVAVTGAYGADGTEYRTERESFTKVVSYITGGSIWFKAWTRGGQIMEYGNTTDSWIEAQGRTAARVWGLSKLNDKAGNYLTINYEEDTANGDYRPTRIDYAGNTAGGVVPFSSARFTYEDRTDIKPQYVAGSVIKRMKRLTNVKTHVNETLVTDYRLTYDYSPDNGPSRVTSIRECNGAGTECFSPISLTWENPSGGGFLQSPAGSYGHRSADFNGDGMTDLVLFNGSNSTLEVSYSTGSGFQAPVAVGTFPPNTALIVGDFDGNGRADILADDGTVWLSTASGFTQTTWSGTPLPSFVGMTWSPVGDFDGDGRADIAYESGGTLYVRYSTGSGFAPAVSLGLVTTPLMFGDFDGNGRSDILAANGAIWLSNPSGFSQSTWAHSATWLWIVGDFNGDGLADITYTISQGMWVIAYSNGNGFDAPVQFNSQPLNCGCNPGDFDGNGRDDLHFAITALWTVRPATPDRVSTITTSLNATIGLTYKPLTDPSVYAKDSDAQPPIRDLKHPIDVVSRVLASDGIGGSRTTDYFYRGAKSHTKGGGFLGFRQVEATDVSNSNLKSVTTFDQAYPYHRIMTQRLRTQSSGTVIQQTDETWTKTALTPAPGSGGSYHKVEPSQSVERNYELNASLLTTVTSSWSSYDAYSNPGTVSVSTGDGYSKTTSNTYSNDLANWILGRLASSCVTSNKPSGSTPPLSLTRCSGFIYYPMTGLLTKEMLEPGDSNLCLVSAYQQDDFGNRTSTTTRNCNASPGEAAAPTGDAVFATRTATATFVATTANPIAGQFMTSSSNALNHSEAREFDARFGTPTKLTGPNALVTTWTYDSFGRKSLETRADATTTSWAYALCGTCPPNGRYFVTVTTTGRPTVVTYFDTLNREIRLETQSFDGTTWARKDTEYDSLGQVRRVSQPYFAAATPKWTCYGYDVLTRVTSERRPTDSNDNTNCNSPAVTTTNYNGFTTTQTNALGQVETRVKNSQGQLVQVTRQ